MKKGCLRFLCLVLCMMLVMGCTGGASAAGKKTKRLEISGLGDITDDWYYVTSTVPAGYLYQDKVVAYISTNDGSDDRYEYADTCEITFKKGEEALKDALVARREDDNHWYIFVDNSALTVAGQAVFHLKAESDAYLFERDFTINVLNWNEYPLLVAENEHPVIDAKLGQVIKDEELMAYIGQLNTDEIFSKVLKLKTRSWMASDYFIPRSNYDVEYTGQGLSRNYGGSIFERRYDTVIQNYGNYDIKLIYNKGNIRAVFPLTISVRGYSITAKGSPTPGGSVKYSVSGSVEGRTFTWSLEGEGATIDPESGEMTISPEAPAGTVYTVTAIADNGDMISTRDYYPGAGSVFAGIQFSQTTAEGFGIPTPNGGYWRTDVGGYYKNEIFTSFGATSTGYSMIVDANYYEPSSPLHYAENPEVARAEIQKDLDGYTKKDPKAEQEIIDLDGHPVGLVSFSQTSWGTEYNVGCVIYLRNNRYLRVRAYTQVMGDQSVRIGLNDLKVLAYKITYDENEAPLSAAKAKFTVNGKDGMTSVSAGKNLQMEAAFENAELINKKEKNNGVSWSVVNAETGEVIPEATIAANGQLKVDKGLGAPVELLVKGVSTIFGTEASVKVTAVPVASKVTTEPVELFFYVGTEDAQTVKVSLEPATVPPVGLTWTPVKAGIVEITEVEDGMVSIKPLAAGKTDIAVKEPGGKNAKLKVNVVAPVESVELKANGAAKAGGKVKIVATLSPKDVGNKTVQWSVDVGEDVAKIDDKGQLTIAKGVPSGTKITVTCTAVGAPNPVIGTIVIDVP